MLVKMPTMNEVTIDCYGGNSHRKKVGEKDVSGKKKKQLRFLRVVLCPVYFTKRGPPIWAGWLRHQNMRD